MMPTTMGPSTTSPKKRSTLGWLSRLISSASCQKEAQWRSTCREQRQQQQQQERGSGSGEQ